MTCTSSYSLVCCDGTLVIPSVTCTSSAISLLRLYFFSTENLTSQFIVIFPLFITCRSAFSRAFIFHSCFGLNCSRICSTSHTRYVFHTASSKLIFSLCVSCTPSLPSVCWLSDLRLFLGSLFICFYQMTLQVLWSSFLWSSFLLSVQGGSVTPLVTCLVLQLIITEFMFSPIALLLLCYFHPFCVLQDSFKHLPCLITCTPLTSSSSISCCQLSLQVVLVFYSMHLSSSFEQCLSILSLESWTPLNYLAYPDTFPLSSSFLLFLSPSFSPSPVSHILGTKVFHCAFFFSCT